jgi:hypothetical protein
VNQDAALIQNPAAVAAFSSSRISVVVAFFQRDELGVRDLACRTPCLIEEVGIRGPEEDKA